MLGALYCCFGFFVLFYEVIRRKNSIIDTISVVNGVWLLNYILPAIAHVYAQQFNFVNTYTTAFGWNLAPSYYALDFSIMFYLNILLVYFITKKKQVYAEYVMKDQQAKMERLSTMIVIFSLVVFLVYSMFFGGPVHLILNANKIRYHSIVNSNDTSVMFINKLFLCAKFSPILLIGYWDSKIKVKFKFIMYLLITFIITMSDGSRGDFLIFIMTFLLGKLIKNNVKKFNVKHSVIITVLVYVGVVLLRPFIDVLSFIPQNGVGYSWGAYVQAITGNGKYSLQGNFSGIFDNLMNSLDYMYVSLETSIRVVQAGIHTHNYFMEFVIALTNIIPSKILGISKGIPIQVYNSAYISGTFYKAQIPPGVIAAAYYDFGIIGIPLYGTILGFVGSRVDTFFLGLRKSMSFAPYYYVSLLFLYYDIGLMGDLASTFANNFTTIIILIIIRIFIKKVKNPVMAANLPLLINSSVVSSQDSRRSG